MALGGQASRILVSIKTVESYAWERLLNDCSARVVERSKQRKFILIILEFPASPARATEDSAAAPPA